MCQCCYFCIKTHSDGGCQDCLRFLEQFFPATSKLKVSKSVARELKSALAELFEEMDLSIIKVEGRLELDCASFIRDICKMLDEIKSGGDIVSFWHVSADLAMKVFSVISEVIFGDDTECSSSEDEMEDIIDQKDLSGSDSELDKSNASSSDEDV